MNDSNFIGNYLKNIKALFRYYKNLGDKTFAQLGEEELFHSESEHSNNIAVIAKHIAGNALSRFTDFLHSDGEKSWRNRESEFEQSFQTKEEVLTYWEKGWRCVFEAIDPLEVGDMSKIAYIRNEGHSVMEALNRQLGHYSYHVGQMVWLGKKLKGENWESLSIPKGQSEEFNAKKFQQEKQRKNFI